MVVVSIVGSMKAISFTKKDPVCERLIDFALGILSGVLMGFYVAPKIGMLASLIVALISAIGGVLIIEAIATSAPSLIIIWLKGKLGIKE